MNKQKIGQRIYSLSSHWSWSILSSIAVAAIVIALFQFGRHMFGPQFVIGTAVVFDQPIFKIVCAAAFLVWVINLGHDIRNRRKEKQ
ncbi:hypothetical protein [Burkholderia cepacia]|uniref:hypothetical protein n=1 Tax=Burkholderia cepacia TaxID=292 RepID=UPI002AB62B85|nr:hypothetical protein [Burkholderia cepacia]